MRLEDEIKQYEFRSQAHKASLNIFFTHHWLQSQVRDFLKPFDITSQQFNVLRILRGQFPNPATINLLKERMLEKRSDVSRIVERLRIKKLLKRKPCSSDRREVEVVINEKGLELLKQLDELENTLQARFSRLSEEDLEHLNKLLDMVRGS